jgi:streptogramin lyase
MRKVRRGNRWNEIAFGTLLLGAGCAQKAGQEPPVEVEEVRAPLSTFAGVLTQHNDLFRTGANTAETVLGQTNVNATQFGKVASYTVDGQIYAQPLYVPKAMGATNVVVVATENNKVTAFDADSPSPGTKTWERALEPTWTSSCGNTQPSVGISATPVIDAAAKTIYVAVKTKSGTAPVKYLLHALDLLTGNDKVTPLEMGLDPTGKPYQLADTGPGSTNGQIAFDPTIHQNRVALTLTGDGVLLAGFASLCDNGNYRGWVLRFDAANMKPLQPFLTAPSHIGGGAWMGGSGIAVDETNAAYFITGNDKTGDDTSGTTRFANAFVKLTGGIAAAPTVASWFMPFNLHDLNSNDWDLGSSGPLHIPGTTAGTGWIVGGGKEGVLFVLDRNALGGFRAQATPSDPMDPNAKQRFQVSSGQGISLLAGPVYWESQQGPRVYIWPAQTPLRSYAFDRTAGKFTVAGPGTTPTPLGQGSPNPDSGHLHGGYLSISANGNQTGTGIVWATHGVANSNPSNGANGATSAGVLYAFNADDVTKVLWDSTKTNPAGLSNSLASFSKYCPPTIANGKVYVGTFSNKLEVYGLLSPPSPDAGARDGGARDAPAARDAGSPVVDAAPDVPAQVALTCGEVDASGAPSKWSDIYNELFAPGTVGHCGTSCHGGTNPFMGFRCDSKDVCYDNIVAKGFLINGADAGAAWIGDPNHSILAWFGAPAAPRPWPELMPRDQQVMNRAAVAALCSWARAGAVNDITCAGSTQLCGNTCVDLSSDSAHCGSCANACPTGSTCQAGLCCASGLTSCGGTCVALGTNQNCAACGDACAANASCSPSHTCLENGGQTCTAATDCLSGACADGKCCDTACTGACQSCATGTCTAVKGADDADTCTGNNTCDSSGTCKLKQGQACTQGTQCASTFCADGVCCNAACTGSCLSCTTGTCTTVKNADDLDTCTGLNTCSATGVCKLKKGQACSAASACASNFCADGVCCNSACNAACRACGTGTCAVVKNADDADTCTGASTCSAAGACKLKAGQACTATTQCASGFCPTADGVCCNAACTGSCQSCGTGTCAAVKSADDADTCTGASTCDTTGTCKLKQGQACTTTTQCASGFCADSVCCDAACTGSCLSCSTGTCNPVTNATDPGTCDSPSSCDASGVCKGPSLKANGTACAAGSECTSNICVDGVCCNAACTGSCLSCSTGTCAAVKNADDPDTCTGLNTCSATGVCKLKKGQACSAASACASSFCADGVCCNSACNTACRACGTGTCAVVKNTDDPDTCTGVNTCSAAGACKLKAGQACTATTQCASGFCPTADGVCCNAACTGSCLSCGTGTCAAVKSADDADTCTGASTCDATGTCKLQQGQACTTATQCASGFCADGVCCNAACTGSCLSCASGTCTAVTNATDPGTCDSPNSCDGSSVCQAPPALKPIGASCGGGSECASTFCADGHCCNTACNGLCQACGTGTCAPVLNAPDPDTCAGTQACDPTGACRPVPKPIGAPCGTNAECASTFCADGHCCNSACAGLCQACGTGTCAPVLNAPDPDTCAGAQTCDPTGVCRPAPKPVGAPCGTNAECVSTFCADGHCCNSACTGPCLTCSTGTCSPLRNADDPPQCSGQQTCDPNGFCKLKQGQPCGASGACASGSCVDGVCCNTACGGVCQSCSSGTCLPVVSAPDPDTCATPLTCDATGTCSASRFTAYQIPSPNEFTVALVRGPDGALWFNEQGPNKIGRITMAGTFSEFPIPAPNAFLHGMVFGPDSRFWFAESDANKLGVIALNGAISEFVAPGLSYPDGLAIGPGGKVWVAQRTGQLGSFSATPAGPANYTLLSTPGGGAAAPYNVVAGLGGEIWYNELGTTRIGRVAPDGTTISELTMPAAAGDFVTNLVVTPDGKVWFGLGNEPGVGSTTPAGAVTMYPTLGPVVGLTVDSGGKVWFTEWYGPIGSVTAAQGVLEFSDPNVLGGSMGGQAIAHGQDGAIWFTTPPNSGLIVRYQP